MSDPPPKKLNVGGLYVHVFGYDRLETLLCSSTSPQVAVLFFAHGRHGSAKKSFPLCQTIARAQPRDPNSVLLVVTFDQRNHGTRMLEERANTTWKDGNDLHAYDMFAIQYGTAVDISYLVDVLPMYLNVNVQKWGMSGVSLGGHSSLLAFVREPRLSICICFIGCGDYATLMQHRASRAPSTIPATTTRLNNQLTDLLLRVDPIQNIKSFKQRPFLFLGGEKDKLVPPSANDRLFEALREAYGGNGDRFKVVIEEGVGHEVTPAMEKHCVEWVERWIFE
ncbi:hypothetical protein HDV00_004640 [Rhizophlyctis rosea]|nr:hypothetical protein HDV00_004640 [Rhizophlyctis rosea]